MNDASKKSGGSQAGEVDAGRQPSDSGQAMLLPVVSRACTDVPAEDSGMSSSPDDPGVLIEPMETAVRPDVNIAEAAQLLREDLGRIHRTVEQLQKVREVDEKTLRIRITV